MKILLTYQTTVIKIYSIDLQRQTTVCLIADYTYFFFIIRRGYGNDSQIEGPLVQLK
ncbi:hypothetical protein J2S21_002690 [Peribacillus cavernae]|nr:hypothetical protein [Peribacillus cavernae]